MCWHAGHKYIGAVWFTAFVCHAKSMAATELWRQKPPPQTSKKTVARRTLLINQTADFIGVAALPVAVARGGSQPSRSIASNN